MSCSWLNSAQPPEAGDCRSWKRLEEKHRFETKKVNIRCNSRGEEREICAAQYSIIVELLQCEVQQLQSSHHIIAAEKEVKEAQKP